MITKQQRTKLRSYAQKLPDLVFVGKNDLDENVIKQINDNLYAYEIIKIKVNNNVSMTIEELAEEIEDRCNCEVVTIIGNKIVVYKRSDKKTDKKLQPLRDIMSN